MNQKELLLISVTIFLTIIAWMLIDIYKIKTSSPFGVTAKTATTVNVRIDQNVLKILKEKQP